MAFTSFCSIAPVPSPVMIGALVSSVLMQALARELLRRRTAMMTEITAIKMTKRIEAANLMPIKIARK